MADDQKNRITIDQKKPPLIEKRGDGYYAKIYTVSSEGPCTYCAEIKEEDEKTLYQVNKYNGNSQKFKIDTTVSSYVDDSRIAVNLKRLFQNIFGEQRTPKKTIDGKDVLSITVNAIDANVSSALKNQCQRDTKIHWIITLKEKNIVQDMMFEPAEKKDEIKYTEINYPDTKEGKKNGQTTELLLPITTQPFSLFNKKKETGFQLYSFQEDAVETIIDKINEKDDSEKRGMVVSLPTGTGKTIVMADIVKKVREQNKNAKFLLLSSSIATLRQCEETLKMHMPDISIMTQGGAAKIPENTELGNKNFLASTYQSMYRSIGKKFKEDKFDLILIDEAHHGDCASQKGIIEKWGKGVPIVGFTATPEPMDINRWEIAYKISLLDAIKQNRIPSIKVIRGDFINIGEAEVNGNTKDFKADSLADVLKPEFENIAKTMDFSVKDRRCAVFLPTIKSAEDFAEILRTKSLNFKNPLLITSEEKSTIREQKLKDFEKGKYDCIVGVDAIREGFDSPSIDCIVNVRPTGSETVMRQMIGRGLRKNPEQGKTSCLFLDFTWCDKRIDKKEKDDKTQILVGVENLFAETFGEAYRIRQKIEGIQKEQNEEFKEWKKNVKINPNLPHPPYKEIDLVKIAAEVKNDPNIPQEQKDLEKALQEDINRIMNEGKTPKERAIMLKSAFEELMKNHPYGTREYSLHFNTLRPLASKAGLFIKYTPKEPQKLQEEPRKLQEKTQETKKWNKQTSCLLFVDHKTIDSFVLKTGEPITDKQRYMIENKGLSCELSPGLTMNKAQAKKVISILIDREKSNLASIGQLKKIHDAYFAGSSNSADSFSICLEWSTICLKWSKAFCSDVSSQIKYKYGKIVPAENFEYWKKRWNDKTLREESEKRGIKLMENWVNKQQQIKSL